MALPSSTHTSGAASSSSSRPEDSGRISCAECRRRKLKCDRTVPCNQCTKRGCSSLCPDGVLAPKNARASDFGKEHEGLKARLERAEKLLREHGIDFEEGVESKKGRSALKAEDGEGQRKGKGKEVAGTSKRRDGQGEGGHDGEGPAEKVKEEGQAEDWQHSFGTLILGEEGSARYVGATAGSEWLSSESMGTPHALPSSPAVPPEGLPDGSTGFDLTSIFLPGSSPASLLSYQDLRASLPPIEETLFLVSLYYTHFSWNYNVVLESTLMNHISAFYSSATPSHNTNHTPTWTTNAHPHRLALIFMVLSVGSLYDLQNDPNDFSNADRYYKLARASLFLCSCLDTPTVPALQCLHIMANYFLYVDRIKGGDRCWPLWGLIMRLIQAMGIHRDGVCWNLPSEVREERRRIFWETFSEDIFQANCFGRPGGMPSRHFDVEFPEEERPADLPANVEIPASFGTYKFMLSKISSEVLDQVMDVQAPSYSAVRALWRKLVAFEGTIPFHLRCRAAAFVMPSAFPLPADAVGGSPEIDASKIKLTYQQHLLSLNVCEAVFFLQRPLFARALRQNPEDPSRGSKGEAFLSVVERCGTIIAIVNSLQSTYPLLAPRQWFFWYHGSSAAVCMAALVISAPRSPLALFAWSTLTSFRNLLASLPNPSKSNSTSLALLLRLSTTAWQSLVTSTDVPFSLASASNPPAPYKTSNIDTDANEESNHLLGLHTRLIARSDGIGRDHMAGPMAASTASSSAAPIYFDAFEQLLNDANPPSAVFSDQTSFSAPNGPTLFAQPSMDVDLNELADAGFVAQLWADPSQELTYSNYSVNQSVDWDELASQLGINIRTTNVDPDPLV